VMNIMLIAVIERRKEIGVRRALGARKRDIQAQFLVESVVLTVAGGLAGILIGVAAAWVVASRLHWQPFIPMTPVWLGFTVAVVLGLFFGWYPSRRAASLLPIEAMRT
jgi:putative ABC transport system permease protein